MTGATASSGFSVSNWRPFEKNTLRSFFSLTTPSGLVIHGCTLHRKGDSRWVGMPAKSFVKDGVTSWSPIIEFTAKAARERFQTEALAAISTYLQGVR